MVQHWFGATLKFRDDALCQNFAELNPPLVEGINVPKRTLGEDGMLVKGYQFAQCFWSKPIRQNRVGWAIAVEDSMRNQPVWCTFRLHLLRCLAKSKRFGLGENIGQQYVVMAANGIERFDECNEVAWDKPRPLMDQLIKGVLSIGSWFTPIDKASIADDRFPIECDVFSIALHCQLLEICGKALQVLLIRQNGNCLSIEEVVVPNGEQAHNHRQVRLKRGRTKMLIHLVKAIEHGAEVIGAKHDHGGEADRRIHRIAPANPIPESEHVCGIDTKLRHFGCVG